MQEIDDLHQGFLGFILTCHILEGNAGLLFHIDLGLAGAEAAQHTVAAHTLGHGAHHQEDEAEHHRVGQHHNDPGVILHDDPLIFHAHGSELFRQLQGIAAGGQARKAGLLLFGRLGSLFLGQVDDAVGVEFHFRQLASLFCLLEIRELHGGILAARNGIVQQRDQQHDHHSDQQRRNNAAFFLIFSRVGSFGIVIGILFHWGTSLVHLSIWHIISHFFSACNEEHATLR